MTKLGRNSPCPCGSSAKYKKCCMAKDILASRPGESTTTGITEPNSPPDIIEISEKPAPLLPGVPNILLATPWTHHQISTGFCTSMVNLALTMPFPAQFNVFKSRHTADARNAICLAAIDEGYSHIFMMDADQHCSDDTFHKLWKILEEHGHDNTIASAWATVRGGRFKGNTSILFDTKNGVESPNEDSLPNEVFQAYSVGAPGMLFCTAVLAKVQPPWFADLLLIDNALETINEKDDGEAVVYWPLERRMTHDYVFGVRMTEAGVKIMVDPSCKLPHEVLETI